jgi:DNA-binding MarR family transcriptional regulator
MKPRKQPSELVDHVGYWLRLVSNHVSQAFRAAVEELGVTVAEWVVLRELLRLGPTNPSLLAASLQLSRGAVSKLVERLVAKRLIRRREDPHDQRFQVLELTAAGRRLVPHLAARADANDAAFFGHLTAGERSALLETLQSIVKRGGLSGTPID